MSYSINIPEGSDWSMQTVKLDGKMYNIELKFKARTDRWYVTLSDTDGNILLSEKKCVPGQTLTGLYGLTDFGGNLYVQKSYGKAEYPGHDNFGQGKEFELIYFTDEEYTGLLSMNYGYAPTVTNFSLSENPTSTATTHEPFVVAFSTVKEGVRKGAIIPINGLFTFSSHYGDYNVILTPASAGSFDESSGLIHLSDTAPALIRLTVQHKVDKTVMETVALRTVGGA